MLTGLIGWLGCTPQKIQQEYIDSLREDVEWMGWTPVQTTFTSDYFDQCVILSN